MNIQIQSVHFAADKQLKDFINKKVEKLISIDDSIINVDVYLKVDKPESHDNKIAEIEIEVKPEPPKLTNEGISPDLLIDQSQINQFHHLFARSNTYYQKQQS